MGIETVLDELRRLIAAPTIAGQSNVELVADLASELEGHGAVVCVTAGERPDGHNLHAVFGPSDAEGGVVLAAHTDVVDVVGQPWSRDPFQLAVLDGRAHGRGTADMKGFIAVALTVVSELEPRRLREPVHLCLSCDEELGCRGVRPLLAALVQRNLRPDGVIVGEPTQLRVVNRHKGKAAIRIHVRGQAAHSSVATDGVNAVVFASRLVLALQEVSTALANGPRDDGYRIPHATIGIGPIHGGVAVNIVPDECTVEVEVRALPEQDPNELVALIGGVADELSSVMRAAASQTGIELEELMGYPGLAAAGPSPFVRRMCEWTGTAEPAAADFGTEAGLYAHALQVPVVVCGPGSIARAHKADEFIEVAELERALALLRAVVTGRGS